MRTTLKNMASDARLAFPRNPMAIHRIQDALCAVQGDTMIREIIRNGAVYDLNATIRLIKDQIRDGHRAAIVDMVGEEVVVLIDGLEGGSAL